MTVAAKPKTARSDSSQGPWPRRVDPQRLATLLPPQGTWTGDDFLWLTRGGARRIELSDGWIEELPMPTERHQRLLGFLYRLLYAWLAPENGIVVFSALPMRVAEGRYREPDLLALLDSRDPRRGDAFWTGADLVVEIVSPNNSRHDHVTKRGEYAAAGIAEYWIVDADAERIIVLSLDGASYREHGTFGRGERATSPLLPGLAVVVDALFDDA